MHENQKKIIEFLATTGRGATADEIATQLGVTKSAAKEHITKIEDLGYLRFVDVKGLMGRPKRFYDLTQNGHDAFPRQYSWLSLVLLKHLSKSMGPDSVALFMRDLAQSVAYSMKGRFEVKTTGARLKGLLEVLTDLGYRASLTLSPIIKTLSLRP